ncbi:MAG: flagellar basal body P-ring protein FlgI, partial [Burkholderiaceae bacterium]|nr:flagellar basal body P-ring protein FlgI [Burkholderiaceae bacterium]
MNTSKKGWCAVVGMVLAVAGTTIGWVGTASAARLKEIASVQGVRSNPLVGYGLVVGLDGTGDQTTS